MTRKPFAVVTSEGRVVPQSLFEQYATKAHDDGVDSKHLTDLFAEQGFYGSDKQAIVAPLYNPAALARLPELNVYHLRACKTKARDSAGLGWELTPRVENPSDANREILEEFFTRNHVITQLEKCQYDFEAVGWGTLEVVRENYDPDGVPETIVHVPSWQLRVHKDADRFIQMVGTRQVWFRGFGKLPNLTDQGDFADSPANEEVATEILWWSNYTSRSPYYGIPDIVPAFGALQGDLSRRDFNLAFFDNYGVPAYAVFVTGDFDPGDPDPETGETPLEKDIKAHFEKLRDNPHSNLILTVPAPEGGEGEINVTFEALAVEQHDASFTIYRKDNRDEILAAHGVPPYRLGVAETGSLGGSTAEESTEIYAQSIIDPRQDTIEELVNSTIVEQGFGIDDWEFRLVELDTEDLGADLEAVDRLFRMAAARPIDIIRRYGEKYGIPVPEPVPPELEAYYIDGSPVTGSFDPDQAIATLSALKAELLEAAIALDDTVDPDGDGRRSLHETAGSLEATIARRQSSRNPAGPAPN